MDALFKIQISTLKQFALLLIVFCDINRDIMVDDIHLRSMHSDTDLIVLAEKQMGRTGGSVFGAQTHVTSLVLIVSIVMRPDLKRVGGPTTPISITLQKTTYKNFYTERKI